MNNAAPVNAPSPRPSLRSVIKRGKIAAPIRCALYGADGIGKTSFAASAPDPVFLCAESGTAQHDVARLPEPESWMDVLSLVDQLVNEEHDYKTFVVDGLTWLEPVVHQHVCQRAKKKNLAEFDFGRGYSAALDEWRVFVSKLEQLWRKRNMNIVLLAHAHTANVKNPAGTDYGIICPKLHQAAEGLFREWVDAVLYAEFQTFEIGGDSKRAKVISDGARVMHTQHRGAFRAKNRYDLPETLPLDWHAFADAVAAHQPADPARLRARITALLEQTTDADLHAKVSAAVEAAGDDASKLAKYADHLTAKLSIQAKENAE